jgi:putative endonuclease
MKSTKTYFVYMLECKNGSFYTGYTVDIKRRYQKHLDGTACKYTRSFPPKSIAACWELKSDSASEAMKIEAAIKILSVVKKKELVSNPELLRKKYCNVVPYRVPLGYEQS